jgi:hypothetical protein
MTNELTQIVISVAAFITAIGVIAMAANKIYGFARRIEKAIGEDSKGRSISDRLAKVEYQVFPNGGGSLSDQISELSTAVTTLVAKTETIENMMTGITANAMSNNNKRSSRSPRETAKSTTVKNPTTTKK